MSGHVRRPRRLPRLHSSDVPLLGFFVMSAAVIGMLIVVACMHQQLLELRGHQSTSVTDVQLVTK